MVTTSRPASTEHFDIIGTRPIRPDGVDKVTGRAIYGADVQLPGLLYGRVLRSPYAHARIVSIDTSRAESHRGVKAVITGRAFPLADDAVQNLGESATSLRELSDNLMAHGKVLYQGHAVAAVAATSLRVAEEALSLIDVQYEPLPPLLDVRQAMAEESPIVDIKRRTKDISGTGDRPSNVASRIQLALGDVAEGFAEADVVIEHEYRTKMVHQGYIEPQAATAFWNSDGQITVWTTTQGAFSVRDQISSVLKLPVSRIKVVPTEIGGGFGGKLPIYLEAVAVLLSERAGAPVKLTMSRTEVLQASGPTSGASIKLKLGATKGGKFTAVQADLAFEAGAFAGSPVGGGALMMLSPYEVPNLLIDGYDVVVNKPKVAAYRAPGAPIAAFAIESAIDELAQKLGMDPIDLRLQNAAKQGTRLANGVPIRYPVGNIDVLEAAKNSPHYCSPLPESTASHRRGRGVATGFWTNASLKSSVAANVNRDGTVTLVEGNPDIGGTRASLAMQLAESLGIPYESIKPQVVDTDSVGYNDVTGGSRTTFAGGIAVYECAQDIIRQLLERASQIWGISSEDIRYEHGVIVGPSAEHRLTFKEIARQLLKTGAPVVGRATVSPKSAGYSYGTHIADVEIDAETGKVDVLRYTVVQDVGRAVHPSYVEGQMQGGASQGIGWALNEEYYYETDGRLANSSLLDYRMPTTLDLPFIETIIVEVPHPGHPFGVRGVGEVPIVPPLAAVANAVSRALRHRFTELPLSPRRIFEETLFAL